LFESNSGVCDAVASPRKFYLGKYNLGKIWVNLDKLDKIWLVKLGKI